MRVLGLVSLPVVAASLIAAVATTGQRPGVPENPCALLSAQDMAAVTGLPVTEARRLTSIMQDVRAQEEGRAPDPGVICSYKTSPQFESINIVFSPEAPDMVGAYEEKRDRYFRMFPGSAELISDVGQEAWLAGGNSLMVLTVDRRSFSVSTQMYDRRSRTVLISVARAVLARLQ